MLFTYIFAYFRLPVEAVFNVMCKMTPTIHRNEGRYGKYMYWMFEEAYVTLTRFSGSFE